VQWRPRDVDKEYDVCYIANHPQADIKRIKWVYKTVPKDLKVLHLGIKGNIKHPKNVIRKCVPHAQMPKWISKCRVGIIPYKEIDSAPRALVEMVACGLQVVVLNTVRIWKEKYPVSYVDKHRFWNLVKMDLKTPCPNIRRLYEENLSISVATQHLRDLINDCSI
jgi:hypothetical protein